MVVLTGSNSHLVPVPYDEVYGQGIEDMLHRQPSIEKVETAIGWRPTFGLEAILRDVVHYVRSAPAYVADEAW